MTTHLLRLRFPYLCLLLIGSMTLGSWSQGTPPAPGQITLLQALPKGKLFESIVQKTTELGVARVVPILSERVVAHLDNEDGAQKANKLRHVAVEAIKQCGSAWLPQTESPMTPKQFLARKEKFDLPLIASLQSEAMSGRSNFSLRARNNSICRSSPRCKVTAGIRAIASANSRPSMGGCRRRSAFGLDPKEILQKRNWR